MNSLNAWPFYDKIVEPIAIFVASFKQKIFRFIINACNYLILYAHPFIANFGIIIENNVWADKNQQERVL